MEAAALAQRSHSVRESMVNVMEEHLVPAVLATQDQGHDIVQHGPGASRILCKELVPGQRVGEVRDEHPGRRESNAGEEGNSEHEAPALAERTAQRVGAKQPDASPKGQDEGVVFHTTWHPLAPELLVALAAGTFIREMHPPLQGEQGSSVIQAEEVDHRDPWCGQQVLVPVGAPRTRPLLQSIVELFRIPTELALDEQIHRAGMVAVVLKHELLPGQ
mmetsp:Transcript_13435/g.32051  ORF Transcript_13435/g.32051 Transcript_13435/m.32051 type:complete len:218 (-) Transcript_13435:527-1180(-)